MRTLNLCCNRIESVQDDAFHHLPSLAYLDLGRNRIGKFSMDAVVNVTSLALGISLRTTSGDFLLEKACPACCFWTSEIIGCRNCPGWRA